MICRTVCFIFLLAALANASMLEVDVVAFGVFGQPTMASLYYHTATMELAVKRINSAFNGSLHVNLQFVFDNRQLGCGQYLEDISDMVARWYYKKRRPENASISIIVNAGIYVAHGNGNGMQ